MTINVKQFTDMAEWINKYTPPVQVPSIILSFLRSAITLRKRCADWFSRIGKGKEQHQVDVSHRHFIQVLEKVLHTLEPKAASANVPVSTSPNHEAAHMEDGVDGMANLFDILSTDDTTLNESADGASIPHQGDGQSKPPGTVKYVWAPTDEEVYFALYCFFDDLDQLRGYLSDLWTFYKDGSVDLVTASVTTNTAFELVQRAERDLIATFPKLDNYEKIMGVFFMLMCHLRGEDPEYREQPDDVVNFSMLDAAEFTYLPIYSTLCSFCDFIQGGYAPVCKPGYFGTYDPHCDRNQLTIRQRMQEDRVILLETLPEFFVLSQTKDKLLEADELTHGIREMCLTRKVPLWVAYATQIYLDIHHILRADVTRGLADLKAAGSRASASLKNYFAHSQIFKNWPANNERGVKSIEAYIDDCIAKDVLGIAKRRIYGTKAQYLPKGQPYALLRWHPILCGLFQFSLYQRMQESGIILATAWGSILYVAHLYHACRQSGHLGSIWEDMELIMKIHTPERMFAGRVPETPTESLNSMCIMLGTSAVSFSRPDTIRHPGLAPSRNGPKGLTAESPMTEVLGKRFSGTGDLSLTLKTVEHLIEQDRIELPAVDESTDIDSTNHSILQKQWAKSHKLTVLQLLEALRYAMTSEKYALRFDYYSFHLRCLDLLRAVRTELDEKLRQYFGDDYLENDTQLPFVVGYIFMVAQNTQKVGESLRLQDATESRIFRALRLLWKNSLGERGIWSAKSCWRRLVEPTGGPAWRNSLFNAFTWLK